MSGVIDEIKVEPSARDYPDKSALHPVNAIDNSTSNINIPQGQVDVNGCGMQEVGEYAEVKTAYSPIPCYPQ